MMRRSLLEIYIDILKTLHQKGPLILTHLMHKANLCCVVLKERLSFLMKHGLVEEKNSGTYKVIYAITEKGKMVLENFKKLNQVIPVLENLAVVASFPQKDFLHETSRKQLPTTDHLPSSR